MKKYFVSVALMALVAACSGGDEKKESKESEASETTAVPEVKDPSENPDYKAGLKLISASDCSGCHKATEKVIGPAFQEVANKYAGQDTAIAYLSKKIIAGGSGVWGAIPMAPHPQLAQADVEQMVKYILSLKQ